MEYLVQPLVQHFTMSTNLWRICLLFCVGLQAVAAIATLALKGRSVQFVIENVRRLFLLRDIDGEPPVWIHFIPPGVDRRAILVALTTSAKSLFIAAEIVAFILFANSKRKRVSLNFVSSMNKEVH